MEANMLRLDCLLAACMLALAINIGAAEATGHGAGAGHGAGGWHGASGHHFVGRHLVFGRGHRVGKRNHHFGGNGIGAFGGGYFYGDGTYGTPNYSNEPDGSVSQPQPLPATYALDCPPSEKIVTVPLEHGPGEVKVRVIYGTGTKCRLYRNFEREDLAD
jgi:hypothetical protein